MSNTNIIPTVVPGLGPILSRFPPELLLSIFEFAMFLDRSAGQSHVVVQRAFDTIIRFGDLRDALLVSKIFRAFATQAFYQVNDFIFNGIANRNSTQFRTSLSPAFPPIHYRNFLRRIRVDLIIEDSYRPFVVPGAHNGVFGAQVTVRNIITNVTDLLLFCPAARSLAALTDASRGFDGLSFLDLNILMDVRGSQNAFLAVFQAAGFSARARYLKVSITSRQNASAQWLACVNQAIARV